MFPHKTDQAHAALQSHAGPLSLRERRMLILCDGKRHVDELTALFGSDALPLVASLHERGFLRTRPVAMAQAAPPAPSPPPPAPPVAAPPTAAPAGNPRRSLVAAKMYMLGMLELQRSEEAMAQRLHLQASREPDEVVAHLLASLRFLQERTNPSMAQRVRDRLAEALPEEYLPVLEATQAAAA